MTTVNVVGMLICLTVLNVFAKIQKIQKSEVIFIINKTKKVFSLRDCTEKNGPIFKTIGIFIKFLLFYLEIKRCKYPVFKSDGKCDDENNIPECDWDGGDCCGCNIVKGVCSECACKDPEMQKFVDTGS